MVRRFVEDEEVGKLEDETGEKLNKRLNKFLKELGKDRIDKACKVLDKFIKDVNKLINKGKLDAEDGDPLPLIEQVEAIKSVAGC